MPKKSAARGGAQRNKPRVQKSIELVRQTVEEKEVVEAKDVETGTQVKDSDEPTTIYDEATVVALDSPSESVKSGSVKNANGAASKKKAATQTPGDRSEDTSSVTTPKGTAAARFAARRQGVQRAQQRAAASLITAEHYSYVRRELITIAIIAFIMFSVLIILHFVPGIGG